MANRKGVFLGAYLDPILKRDIQRAATAAHRTMSQEVTRRLTISLYGSTEIPGRKAGGRLTPALLHARPETAPAPRRHKTPAAVTTCSDGYTRHRFWRKHGGPTLRKCVRCRTPNPAVRAAAR